MNFPSFVSGLCAAFALDAIFSGHYTFAAAQLALAVINFALTKVTP